MNQFSLVVVVMLIMVHTEAIEVAFQRDSENNTAQKMKFSIKDFFSKCVQICSFLNGKLSFLCSVTILICLDYVIFGKKSFRETFLSNVAGCVFATLLKTDSNADIFLKFFKPAILLENLRMVAYFREK